VKRSEIARAAASSFALLAPSLEFDVESRIAPSCHRLVHQQDRRMLRQVPSPVGENAVNVTRLATRGKLVEAQPPP
jgi:hypothetical protein